MTMNEQFCRWTQDKLDWISFVIHNHKEHMIAQDKAIASLQKRLKKSHSRTATLAFIAGICFCHVLGRLEEQDEKIKKLTNDIEELKVMKGD